MAELQDRFDRVRENVNVAYKHPLTSQYKKWSTSEFITWQKSTAELFLSNLIQGDKSEVGQIGTKGKAIREDIEKLAQLPEQYPKDEDTLVINPRSDVEELRQKIRNDIEGLFKQLDTELQYLPSDKEVDEEEDFLKEAETFFNDNTLDTLDSTDVSQDITQQFHALKTNIFLYEGRLRANLSKVIKLLDELTSCLEKYAFTDNAASQPLSEDEEQALSRFITRMEEAYQLITGIMNHYDQNAPSLKQRFIDAEKTPVIKAGMLELEKKRKDYQIFKENEYKGINHLAENKTIFDTLGEFKQIIQGLETKQQDLLKKSQKRFITAKTRRNYEMASEAAGLLYKKLNDAGDAFFTQNRPPAQHYVLFKKTCDEAIKTARPQLARHRGWSETLANIAFIVSSVASLGVANIARKVYTGDHHFFKPPKTKSEQLLDDIVQEIRQLPVEVCA
ncbi:hypothetical protein [Legionella spiritensis]|uniref:hypothetical protein n=1 Tax=Legionella spiritensis TaxID=452 RepID=UPI000F7011C5|nr:hypothetical protein [Legionella spiritensis]VEG90374.1 ninein [Legionella spiritensis]